MLAWVRTWWRRGRTEIGLYALEDRLLADMGVCRRHLRWHLRTGKTCRPGGCDGRKEASRPGDPD